MLKRHLAAAGCAVLFAGMAGCSNPPSEVAEVAGQQIRVEELREEVTAAETALDAEPGSISTPAIAQFMIGGLVADRVATETGLRVSAEQQETFVMTAGSQLGGLSELWADPQTRPLAEDWMAPLILAEQLGQAQYLAAAAEVPVELNPAYGSWDPEVHGLQPGGSLSVPSAQVGQ